MSEVNNYQAPQSQLDNGQLEEYSVVKSWSPKGRLGRLWFYNFSFVIPMCIMFGLLMLIGFIAQAMMTAGSDNYGPPETFSMLVGLVFVILAIVFLVYGFVLTIQRCHDFDASGWFCLLNIVPVMGFIFYLYLLFMPGTQGQNRFGHRTRPNTAAPIVISIIGSIFTFGIIGIYAAIAIPAYNSYIERAELQKSEQHW